MRKFDLSLRSSRSSYFATFRHQLTILSKTDALDEEKWLRSEERFSRNAETELVCRLLLEKKKIGLEISFPSVTQGTVKSHACSQFIQLRLLQIELSREI